MEQETTVHKRRPRYKGKYPKRFEEKYKELQPEKYQDTIEHVISKGNTPAGMHISIMVNEILDFLKIQPGEIGFDATLGYGGHTKAMLQQLQLQGHIYATDVDPVESAKTKKRLADQGFGEDLLTVKLQNFCTIDEIAKEAGVKRVVAHIPEGVEVSVRRNQDTDYVFVQNFNRQPVEVKLPTERYPVWLGEYDGTIGRFGTVVLKGKAGEKE